MLVILSLRVSRTRLQVVRSADSDVGPSSPIRTGAAYNTSARVMLNAAVALLLLGKLPVAAAQLSSTCKGHLVVGVLYSVIAL